MENRDNGTGGLPWRPFILVLMALNATICVTAGLKFWGVRRYFPAWFGPVFVGVIGALTLLIGFFFIHLLNSRSQVRPGGRATILVIWALIVCSVPCTSALHRFYPFRSDVFSYWRGMNPGFAMIKYNFVLTAVSLLALILLALVDRFVGRRAAVMGLSVLATIMLIPNDNCRNAFNLPWIQWIGASPLMFMPNSVLLLIGCGALCGVRSRAAILAMALINLCVLALGIGHITGVVW